MIPYSRQDISQDDIDAVVSVLKSDFLTQGPLVPLFENTVKSHVESKYAVAVNSSTSALHIACLSLNLGVGDWLWTSPITFVASANCGLFCGANVDFVDIDPRTFNISPQALEEKLIAAEKKGTLPKILVAVHLCGQSCEMDSLYSLCQRYGVKIIEDASHAIGGKYKQKFIGNCRFSDITVFSFHPVKIITTGEGGMAVTNDERLAKKMSLLRSHGITRDEHLMTHASDGPWYYQQIELGFNYRMTDIQAALGVSQMQRLDEFVSKRNMLASRYDRLLSKLPIITPWRHPDNYSAMHLYVIRLKLNDNKTHLEVFKSLRKAGLMVNLHYIPIHTQPYYQRYGFAGVHFKEAERYYKEAISLPIFNKLTYSQQDKVIKLLHEVLE